MESHLGKRRVRTRRGTQWEGMHQMPATCALTLRDFEGSWRLDRQIFAAGAPDAYFTGTARWVPEGENLRYREEGQLALVGQKPMRAEREYIWTPAFDVYFPDGRFFHTVKTGGEVVNHWCDPDTYIGMYDFSLWPSFSVTWRVTGPKKDYRSQSEYHRL